MIKKGKYYIKNGKYNQAIDISKQALLLEPKSKYAWRNLGVAYYYKEEYDKVINAFNRALELDPNNIAYWNNLGVACIHKGNFDKAIDAFKRILDINTEYESAWRNICIAYNKKGVNFDFRNLKPNSDVSWYFLAKELLYSEFYEDALYACERCLSINPSFHDAFKIREKTKKGIQKQKMEILKPKKIIKKVEVDPLLVRFRKSQEKARKRKMEMNKSKKLPKEVKLESVGVSSNELQTKNKPIFISNISYDILDSNFVVDGANVAFGTQKFAEIAKLSNLEKLMKKLEFFGINQYKIICDKSLFHKIDEPEKYNQYIEKGDIIETPAGTEADYFILQYALDKNAFIISNDMYKDFYNAFGKDWIKKKRITFTFIEQEIFLDKLMKLKVEKK